MSLPRTLLAALLLLTGCPGFSADPPPDYVERMAALSNTIEANPTGAELWVQAEGLTPETYRAVMFRIAMDPQMRRSFLEAQRAPTGSGGLPAP